MYCHRGFLLVGAIVLAISGFVICQEASSTPEFDGIDDAFSSITTAKTSRGIPTYVSKVEKLIMLIAKPFEIVDDTINGIGDVLKDALKKLPWGRKVEPPTIPIGKSLAEVLEPFKDKIRAIYPGTLWCGDGDIAQNSEELGFFNETDACCRGHDTCTGGIPAHEGRDGLWNNGLFTRSPCHCDYDFYHCLKDANNIIAFKLGSTYFNILRPQCFQEDYPVVGCKKRSFKPLTGDKCEEYEFDFNGEKKVQWFDNPDFVHIL